MEYSLKEIKEVYQSAQSNYEFINTLGSVKGTLDFYSWWKKGANSDGHKPGSIHTVRKDLLALRELIDENSSSKESKIIILNKRLHVQYERLRGYNSVQKKYKTYRQEALGINQLESKNEERTLRAFYYHKEPRGKPSLGLSIIKELEENRCEVDNIEAHGRPNYSGTYHRRRNGITDYIVSCQNDTEWLFIKSYSTIPYLTENVTLAAYLTYQNNHIVTGTIILQAIKEKEKSLNSPDIFTHESDQWEVIPAPIRDFLSMRRLGWHKTPNDLDILKKIQEYMNKGMFTQRPQTRFFQVNKQPRVFIASNSGFAEKHKSIIVKVKKDLNEQGIPADQIYEYEVDNNANFNPDKNLREIKRCELFICFATQTNKHSFTMLELGWAAAYSKKVLLFSDKNSVSGKIGVNEIITHQSFDAFNTNDENQLGDICDTINLTLTQLNG